MAPGYIIVWRSPASCERRICTEFNPSTVKVISWYLWPDAPVSRLTAGLKVNMLQRKNPRKVHKIWEMMHQMCWSVGWICGMVQGYSFDKYQSFSAPFHILLKLWVFFFEGGVYIYPAPLSQPGCDTRSVLKGTYSRFEFSFPSSRFVTLIKLKTLPYYLPITQERRDRFMLLVGSLVQSEVQTTRFKIWMRVTDFIF